MLLQDVVEAIERKAQPVDNDVTTFEKITASARSY